jgi:hypothetical protein
MTASAKVSAPPSATAWAAATVTNYTAAAQRPSGVIVQTGGSITFTDGTNSMTLNVAGQYHISPLNVTAVTAPAYVTFQ